MNWILDTEKFAEIKDENENKQDDKINRCKKSRKISQINSGKNYIKFEAKGMISNAFNLYQIAINSVCIASHLTAIITSVNHFSVLLKGGKYKRKRLQESNSANRWKCTNYIK